MGQGSNKWENVLNKLLRNHRSKIHETKIIFKLIQMNYTLLNQWIQFQILITINLNKSQSKHQTKTLWNIPKWVYLTYLDLFDRGFLYYLLNTFSNQLFKANNFSKRNLKLLKNPLPPVASLINLGSLCVNISIGPLVCYLFD